MREPGGAEVLADAVRKPLVLAQDDAEHERAPHAVRATSHRTLDSVAQTVSDARDAAATSDLAPRAAAEDHVDPLSGEPCPLVEAVLGAARLGHAHDRLQDRAARRRAADGEHQQGALA